MKEKKVFVCSECGFDSPKWSGKCPSCGEWNTMSEFTVRASAKSSAAPSARTSAVLPTEKPLRLSQIAPDSEKRVGTGISEFDRVFGGGIVRGELVLLSGEPGIGKSTLLLQACANLCRSHRVLYVSGEESPSQLKMRAARLGVGVGDGDLFILSQTDIDAVLQTAQTVNPDFIVIDSVQTMFSPSVDSMTGSVSQVKECTFSLMRYAKQSGAAVLLVGHVNKDGGIAGPKVLEHMVDCVLYFEGDKRISYRLLRCVKNRFGSTDETGVFDMREDGLAEVPSPSEALLSGRPDGAPGSCVVCAMEGTRPVLAEIQALITQTVFGTPRRMSSGIDYNRMVLLTAILEKRAGLIMSNCDAYVNVIGGLKIFEPAADLAAAIAIASSFKNRPTAQGLAAFGEIGLTGELRAVSFINQRLNEIKRLGFTHCIVPEPSLKEIKPSCGIEIIPAKSVSAAIARALV